MTDGFEHALHLMFSSLMDRHFQPGIALRPTDLLHLRRSRQAIFQFNAPLQCPDFGIVEYTLDLDQIRFLDMVPWVEKRLGEVPVIRQQHESFTIEIQAADRKYAHRHAAQKIFHGRAAFGILKRGHHVLRLVQQNIDIGLCGAQMLAVDFDMVAVRIDLRAEFSDHAAVDRDAAGRDQFFSLTPGGQAGSRNQLLQSDFHNHPLLTRTWHLVTHAACSRDADAWFTDSTYSHSMVDGGFELMSYTTRLTPFTSLMIRLDIFPNTSFGILAQSAVIPSRLVTARIAITCSYVR